MSVSSSVWVLPLFCAACGGTLANGDDASTDASAQTDSQSDSTLPFDASPPPPAADAGVSILAFDDSYGQATFIGQFFTSEQQATDGCQVTDAGACSIYECSSGPPPQNLANAGTLTIWINSSPSTVSQDSSGFYLKNGIAFGADDVLGVSGSGGTVPAFPIQKVTAPSMILLSPVPPTSISTAQDFTVSWIDGEPGAEVVVELVGSGNNGSTGVSCTFEPTAGTGTIPQSELVALKGMSGQLFYGQQRKTTFASGSFPINLVALLYATQPANFP
jgi:hypothetical protein